ncbi:MAG: lipopolysaccharide kinase InaA family protein [Lysobacterales bacterium]
MTRTILNEGGWANGTVFVEDRDGDRVVVKSYRAKNWLIRLLGSYLLARERKAYTRLKGIPGIPELKHDPDPLRLAIGFVDGERISNRRLAQNGDSVINSLRQVISDMHARGVYHLDLRNQGNVLVDNEDSCYLIDFASSLYTPPGSWRRRFLGPFAQRFDCYGFSKWENRASDPSPGSDIEA